MNDQEEQATKLKQSFESWREIVVLINSILLWEENWYPGVIIGGSSFLFLTIWLIENSAVTTFCALGLTITLSDYVVPIVSAAIFKPESWTIDKEQEFFDICRKLVRYKSKLEMTLCSFYQMRVTNQKLYYGSTILILAFLAWVGNRVNNLFLSYLLVITLLLLPGMVHHGIVRKYSSVVSQKLSEYTKFKLVTKKEQ